MYNKYFKRPMDFLLSLAAIIVLSPVFLVVSILVKVKLGSPVIFKQQRPGKNEKIFVMYKFRSMLDAYDEHGNLLPDEERLTKFGMLLRKTSLDELPELWNILKGDMSIVGPRPLLVEYLPLYNEKQRQRHLVRPGLSGLAQVSGRNTLDWDNRFDLDIEYVHNISFINDCKIILLTLWKAFVKKEGISQEGHATVEVFAGSGDINA